MKNERTLKDAVTELENSFLRALKRKGVELSEDAICSISECRITVGIAEENEKGLKTMFASEIEIYLKDEFTKEDRINFGSSGGFNPEYKASYWRTLHAASVLKNWDVVLEIAHKYCNDYKDLRNEYFVK